MSGVSIPRGTVSVHSHEDVPVLPREVYVSINKDVDSQQVAGAKKLPNLNNLKPCHHCPGIR